MTLYCLYCLTTPVREWGGGYRTTVNREWSNLTFLMHMYRYVETMFLYCEMVTYTVWLQTLVVNMNGRQFTNLNVVLCVTSVVLYRFFLMEWSFYTEGIHLFSIRRNYSVCAWVVCNVGDGGKSIPYLTLFFFSKWWLFYSSRRKESKIQK